MGGGSSKGYGSREKERWRCWGTGVVVCMQRVRVGGVQGKDGMGWDGIWGGFKALDEVKERKEGGWMDGWMGWYVSYTGGGVAIYASQVRGRGRELGQT